MVYEATKRGKYKQGSENLLISFSGGRTSALMTLLILQDEEIRKKFKNIEIVFANTGCEHEKTLEFVFKCDLEFQKYGRSIHWVEGEYKDIPDGISCRVKSVDYNSASRDGRPFEEFVSVHGLPNSSRPSCTKKLKVEVIDKYVQTELQYGSRYTTAIGIRIDEPQRIKRRGEGKGSRRPVMYYLVDNTPMDKIDVLNFWSNMPFDLDLPSSLGNCVWCWKKGEKVLIDVLDYSESYFDFPKKLEDKYSTILSKDKTTEKPISMFRGMKTTRDIKRLWRFYKTTGIKVSNLIQTDEDLNLGCRESCEVSIDDFDDFDTLPKEYIQNKLNLNKGIDKKKHLFKWVDRPRCKKIQEGVFDYKGFTIIRDSNKNEIGRYTVNCKFGNFQSTTRKQMIERLERVLQENSLITYSE